MKHKAKFMLLWSSYLYWILCRQYTLLTEDVRFKNYQYEQGMQSGNYVIWRCCVLSNLEYYMQNRTKMLHYTAGLSSCLLNTTTYTSQQVLCIDYEHHADLLTIISITIVHKKNNSYLPMNYALFVKMFHS